MYYYFLIYITCSFISFTILTCVTHILSLFYLCLFTLTCKRLCTMYKLLSYIYHVLSNTGIYIYIILNIMYTVQSVIYILYPIIYIECYPIYIKLSNVFLHIFLHETFTCNSHNDILIAIKLFLNLFYSFTKCTLKFTFR